MIGIREQKKQATRQAIEEAAIRLFSTQGFEATSIEDIAVEAGIGKTTIYGYFSAKDEIFLNYCDDRLVTAFNRFRNNQSEPMSLLEELVGFFMLKFGFVTENHEFGRLLLREMLFPKQINEQAKQHDQRYFEIVEEAFRSAIARGELRQTDDLFMPSAHFFSLYLGLLAGWYTGYFSSAKEVEQSMRTLFHQALYGILS